MSNGCTGAGFSVGNEIFTLPCKQSTKNSDGVGSFFRENCYLCLVAGVMPTAVYGQFFRVVKAACREKRIKLNVLCF